MENVTWEMSPTPTRRVALRRAHLAKIHTTLINVPMSEHRPIHGGRESRTSQVICDCLACFHHLKGPLSPASTI